jgi:pyridoxamine 5'-phosphate oxidase family protein
VAFTEAEIAYIASQRLARIATVSSDGQPDVVPVGFEFDGTHFYVGGHDPGRTRRTSNVADGNEQVALVIDDLATVEPWAPRFVRVYGTAEVVDRESFGSMKPVLKITPTISWSINLAGQPLGSSPDTYTPRRAVHG